MQTHIGVFCGIQCAEDAEKFHDKVSSAMPVYESRIGCSSIIKGTISLIGLLGILYGIMFFMFDQTDPMEMLQTLIDQIKKLITIMT